METESERLSNKIAEMQKFIDKIDFTKFLANFQKAFQSIKKNIETLKNSNIVSNIAFTINNEDVQKQISQVEKEIESLQKKIEGRYFKCI